MDNKDPYVELFILAGSHAWKAWGKGDGIEWYLLAQALKTPTNEKTVILGESQLKELNGLRIAHKEQAYIRIFQCGELTQAQITAICHNIAESTQAETVRLCDSLGNLKEDLSNFIQRIRKGETNAEIIAKLVIDEQNLKLRLILKSVQNRAKRGYFTLSPK